MNIPLSLLIYNPIEIYTMVLLCDIISNNKSKINIRNIAYMYLFGFVNFCIQYIPNFWYGSSIYCLISLSEALILHPIVIYLFYVKIIKNQLSIFSVFIASFIEIIFVISISNIFCLYFKNSIIFFNNDILMEFICNFVIFFVQVSLYTFIRRKECKYEEYCKGNRK